MYLLGNFVSWYILVYLTRSKPTINKVFIIIIIIIIVIIIIIIIIIIVIIIIIIIVIIIIIIIIITMYPHGYSAQKLTLFWRKLNFQSLEF